MKCRLFITKPIRYVITDRDMKNVNILKKRKKKSAFFVSTIMYKYGNRIDSIF